MREGERDTLILDLQPKSEIAAGDDHGGDEKEFFTGQSSLHWVWQSPAVQSCE